MITVITAIAQTPQLPNGNPQLPAPKNLKVVAPPDLSITEVRLISATGWSDSWDIRLFVTIKNNGGLIAAESKVRAYVQDASGSATSWKTFVDLPKIPAINPGQSVTTEIRYFDKAWVMHKIRSINLKLKADAGSVVTESNENNNESSTLLISN